MDWTQLSAPIRVINLDRAPRRRTLMATQFAQRGIDFEFAPAIDARSSREFANAHCFNPSTKLPVVTLRPKPVTDGELACTISHLRAIRAAWLAGLDRVVILEDDILFGDLPAQELDSILANIPADAAYAQLIVSGAAPIRILGEWGRRNGRLFARKAHNPPIAFDEPDLMGAGCHAAAAYLVTRAGMASIANCFDETGRVVFPCSEQDRRCNVGLVADRFVFQMATQDGAIGYACTRPSFMLEAADSLLHEDHVPSHQAARAEAEHQRGLWLDLDHRSGI